MSRSKVKFYNYYQDSIIKIIKRLESDNAIKILENLVKETKEKVLDKLPPKDKFLIRRRVELPRRFCSKNNAKRVYSSTK